MLKRSVRQARLQTSLTPPTPITSPNWDSRLHGPLGYQTQLMLLEQQNKKRLFLERQQQEVTVPSTLSKQDIEVDRDLDPQN